MEANRGKGWTLARSSATLPRRFASSSGGYDAAGSLAAALTDFYVVDGNPQPGGG